ncbi:MAG: hypothetical protein NT007_05805 [Candidatus Kapabacteria bacterium]|nr:hypothetical protein [Candidatus Kapabacteria bacterium]
MRKFILLTVIALLNFSFAFAEESTKQADETETLFGTGKVKYSGFGGVHFKYSSVDKQGSLLPGARGGLLIDNTLGIGLAGYTTFPFQDITYKDLKDSSFTRSRNFSYGGLFLEYIAYPHKLLHFTANLILGAGAFNVNNFNNSNMMNRHNNWGDTINTYNNSQYPRALYFIAEPEITAELNVSKYVKVGLSVSYRFVSNVYANDVFNHNQNLKDMKLGGLSSGLYFNFGCF